MANWSVRPLGENLIEITGPEASYRFEAKPYFMSVQATKAGTVAETSSFRRNGHEFTIEAADSRHSTIRLVIDVQKERSISRIKLDNEELQIESPTVEHGLLLSLAIKRRNYPRTPLIKALADELRDNRDFQTEVRRFTGFSRVITGDLPNGPMAVCVAVCAMCAIEVALACLMCFECIENPPDFLVPRADWHNILPRGS